MPHWLIDIAIIVLAAAGIFFSGWLRDRLGLNNWHLLAILGTGAVIYMIGVQNGFLPVIVSGVVVFLFPFGAWSQRGLRAISRKKGSK